MKTISKKLYYLCSFEPIRVHCASEEVTDTVDSDFLPQCQMCKDLERVSRPKKNYSSVRVLYTSSFFLSL